MPYWQDFKFKSPLFSHNCNDVNRSETCSSTLSWQFNLEGSLCAEELFTSPLPQFIMSEL